MSVSVKSRLGRYEILSRIGAGGMGEVYRAKDTKLGRDVAIKVLPEAFVRDRERMERFQREAKFLAALNHPNIAAIYGVEDDGSTDALVMELAEGPTLADRIASGPIPRAEALPIARQIADALEYAHEHGVVHRDLKPANIKVSRDDCVKVLDFGLARAVEGAASATDVANSPTVSDMATRAGVLLGTAAYMAPEQVKAKTVDRRADIWAFGCVLYEMLTGKMAFPGDTVAETLAGILHNEPDWSQLPSETPIRVRVLLQRCLQKDPKQRLRDIGDARISLDEVLSGMSSEDSDPSVFTEKTQRSRQPVRLPWAAAAVLFALAAILGTAYYRASSRPQRTIRSMISAPDGASFEFVGYHGLPTLSPDGTRLVFPAVEISGHEALWMRPLNALTAERLQGTDGAAYPFWSPDSHYLAFFQDGKLKKMPITGGPPAVLCDAPGARGGAWGGANLIVFSIQSGKSLESVPDSGGAPSTLISHRGSGAMFSQRWPEFLPDGRHFLYLAGDLSAPGTSKLGIYVGQIGSNESKFVLQADSGALYVQGGYLLFLRGDTLMAQQFDANNQKPKGEVVAVAQHVASPELFRQGLFSISETGLLIYETSATYIGGQMAWFDAKGKQLGEVGEPGAFDLSLSPDGKQLAYVLQDQQGAKNDDVWLMDLGRNVPTRFTFGPSDNKLAAWSPDGERIAYSAVSQSRYKLAIATVSGTGLPEMPIESDEDEYPTDWSRDGRYIALTFSGLKGQANNGIWVLPLFGDHKPFPYLQSTSNKSDAMFSPDGHWLAYVSDESGTAEVYLSPFPSGNHKWQVSRNGGNELEWSADGRSLYYVGPGGKMIQVSVKENGATIAVGEPRELFQTARPPTSLGARSYSVTRDGKRFLVAKKLQIEASPLTLVTNWTTDLKK